MSRHARSSSHEPTTLAVVHEAGGATHVVVFHVQATPLRISAAETFPSGDSAAVRSMLDQHHVGRVLIVLSAGDVICRTCTLPAASPEQLQQALSLQAEAALLGVAPDHRVGMAVLSSAPGETSRSGIVTAWPVAAAGPRITVEESDHRVVAYAPDIAGVAALLDGLRPSDPLLWVDRSTGAVATAITHSGGAVFRATREAADTLEDWSQAIGRVLAETAINVGHTGAFVDGVIDAAGARLRQVSSDGSLLMAPAELLDRARGLCAGTHDDPDWWNAYGIAVGVAIAATGELDELCVLERDRVEETPSRIDAMLSALAQPRVAVRTAVICLLIVALMPLLSSGARLGILKLRHDTVDEQVEAVEAMHRAVALYDALDEASWPMAKILSDIVSNTPQGIELSMIRLNQADGGFSVSGTAVPHEGRNATEVVALMHRQLRESNIFGDIGLNWGDPTAYGHYQFDLSAKVLRPHRPSTYDLELDYAKWPLAYRQASLDPPGAEDADTGAEIPDEALAAAVPSAPAPSVPNGDDDAAAPPVTEGQEPDRSGRASRPVRRGPEGTRSASGGNLGDAADRADATIAEFAVPEALTQAQVNAMTIEEVRQEITVRAEARRRARSSGDEALEARLRSEFDMLMTRLRKGS